MPLRPLSRPRPLRMPLRPRRPRVPRLPRRPLGKPDSGIAGRPPGRSTGARLRTWWAVTLLTVLAVVAAVLALATYSVADHAMTVTQQAARRTGGPLAIPPPETAGGFPKRFGAISDPVQAAILSEFRQRFGAAGRALLAGARAAVSPPAPGSAVGSAQLSTAWTSALYGEPGHLDPLTFRPSWVMYLGLDTTGMLGRPAATITKLMTGLLGPYSLVGPWPVVAGHRGGSANCTVAWLGQTSMSVCGWATDHTIGALASPVRDTSVRELATMMVKMRFDLQR